MQLVVEIIESSTKDIGLKILWVNSKSATTTEIAFAERFEAIIYEKLPAINAGLGFNAMVNLGVGKPENS